MPWHLLCRAGRLVACGDFEPVAVASGRQHGGVVHDPLDDRSGGRGIEKHLGPASERQIRGHHKAAALVALTDEAEQQVGAGLVELGYLPVSQDGAVLFFQLINARHERASTVLTSNKGFEEWGGVLGDEVMAAALIDRLLHHCHIVNIRGNSYRMREHQQWLGSAADKRREGVAE